MTPEAAMWISAFSFFALLVLGVWRAGPAEAAGGQGVGQPGAAPRGPGEVKV
jgi:hypothetical protein